MNDEPTVSAIRMAVVAAGAGAATRVAIAMYDGKQGRLLVEAFVGAMLGMSSAGVAGWVDPDLLNACAKLFVIGGIGGVAGALGTRVLDLMIAALQKRLGVKPDER